MKNGNAEGKDKNRKIYQKALSDEYDSLRNLMTNGQNAFCRIRFLEDRSVVLQYVNDELCKMLDYSNAEIMDACKEDPIAGVYPEDLETVRGLLKEMMQNGGRINAKFRLRHKSKDFIWARVYGRLVSSANGTQSLNLYIVDMSEEIQNEEQVKELMIRLPSEAGFYDITNQKNLTEAAAYLDRLEDEMLPADMLPFILATIMKSTTDLSCIKDTDFKYLCCSKSFVKMVGLKDEKDIIGRTDYDLFTNKRIADQFRADDVQLLKSKKSIIDKIEEIPSDDGLLHYSSTSKYLLYDRSGKVIGIYGIGRDVTEYRSAFEQLKLLTDCMPGGLAIFEVTNSGTSCKYFSDGIYDLTGYTKLEGDAILYHDITSIIHEEDRAEVDNKLYQVLKDYLPVDITYRIHRADGDVRWVNLQGTPMERQEDRVILNVVIYDITEKKITDEIKRVHDEEMRVAMSQVGKLIVEYDVKNQVLTMPETYAAWYGLPTELYNIPYSVSEFGFLSESGVKLFIEFYEKILQGDKSGSVNIHIRRQDATWHWEHYEFVSIFGDDGKPIKAILSVDDITEQHEIKQRYEYEKQLRDELFSDSLVYYELNLTTNMVEEYKSNLSDIPSLRLFTPPSDDIRKEILARVAPEFRGIVKGSIFLSALRKADSRGNTNFSVEYKRLLPDERYHWVRTRVTIMNKPDSKERVAFLNVTNIDLEKKSRIALDSIIDEEIEFVSVLNIEEGEVYIIKNDTTLPQFEVNRVFPYDDYISQVIDLTIFEEDVERFRKYMTIESMVKGLKHQKAVGLTYRVKQTDGKPLRKSSRAFFLDETGKDLVISYRDITNLYEEEQHQKEMLQEAVDIANKANRAKSEFVSSMSHDMRTPLNAILTLSGKDMLEEASEKTKNDYLEKIHASGEYLLGIINDVLDMSRIESRKVILELAPYSLKAFSNTINTVIGESCKRKGIHFHYEINGVACDWALIDRVRFEQIFINLLSNAVKFTDRGGTIEFLIDTLSYKDNLMKQRFTVRDTGIGMSEDFLPHAFESFSQENRQDSLTIQQGTGLGLAIVEQTINLMGGNIVVNSKIGEGTTFIIELSYYSTSEPKEELMRNVEPGNLSGSRILLCEDNPLNTEIIETLLSKKDIVVESAVNGAEGLRMFNESPLHYYDLILMDKRMPVMGGVEATQKIRKLEREDATEIPIVALTADAFVEDENDSLSIGMNGHIPKPIDPKLLYDTIFHMINK